MLPNKEVKEEVKKVELEKVRKARKARKQEKAEEVIEEDNKLKFKFIFDKSFHIFFHFIINA